jgi:hypothetical protein
VRRGVRPFIPLSSEEHMPHEQEDARHTDRERTVRETREAGLRAQGGGSADDEAIRRAAAADTAADADQPSRSSDASTS